MPVPLVIVGAVLLGADLLHRAVRKLAQPAMRLDGVPSLALVRLTAAVDVLIALLLLAVAVLTRGRLVHLVRLWPRDPLLSIFLGIVGGLVLHAVEGGSPLPVQALRVLPVQGNQVRFQAAGPATVLLFIAGEAGAEFIWRGIALGMLAQQVPVLLAILITAAAYGLRRGTAGQDHPMLGAVDGMLLGVLFRITRSLPAAIVAHLVADVLAYTSSADANDLDVSGLEMAD